MRTLAQRPKARHHSSSASLGTARQAVPGQALISSSIRFAHDFSRTPAGNTVPAMAQPKLSMTIPGDTYEEEAVRVAAQVMRMPDSQTSRPEADEGGDAGQVVTAPRALGQIAGTPGQPLGQATQRFMESRFGHDFRHVRIHADDEAAQAAREVHARAYTVGRDIFFRSGEYSPHTARGRQLLAHELTHVVQQGAAGASGEAAPIAISTAPTPMLARDTSEADAIAAVDAKLAEISPIAGVGDPSGAVAVLAGVSDDQTLLNVLEHMEANYQLDQVRFVTKTDLAYEERQRLEGAMQTVHFAHAQPGSVSQTEINEFVHLVDTFPASRRTLFVRHILDKRGVDKEQLTQTLEGVSALDETSSGAAVPDASVQAAGVVQPAPWNPPAGQPIPFYVGNEAHVRIAANYRASHAGEQVFTNFTPISTIVTAWGLMGNSVKARSPAVSSDLKPDIANLTRTHLYEIKPAASAALAVAEAKLYQGILARAGVPMTLGPTNEPGTAGVVPAPAGVYVFTSPLPGAITYQYRRAKVVPVPVPERQPVKAPGRSRIKLPSFELRSLTDAELRQLGFNLAVVATIGLGLILLLILLAPVGI